MHAVHLPPRHLWRSAALAALLTLAIMALLVAAAAEQRFDSGPPAQTPQPQLVAPQAAPPAVWPSRMSDSSPLKPLATPRPLLEAAQAG